jgi:hypothetical protein
MRFATEWCFLLFPLLLTPVMAREQHWSGGEITQKFEQVDRKLKALPRLEKDIKAGERRLTELEGHVRELRAKFDLFELQMKSMRASIDALRKQLADLGATVARAPGETEPATGNTTAPATPAAEPVAAIRSQRISRQGDFITVSGTVANVSKQPLTFVAIEVAFLDGRNEVIKTESAYTNPRVIAPGATATFKVLTRRDPRIRDHRVSVRTQ